jgi:hypothetical protein
MKEYSKFDSNKYTRPNVVKRTIKNIDEYFTSTTTPTISRLLLHIGMSKETYMYFGRGECQHWLPELTEKMNWARLVVEARYEDLLLERNPTGPIFLLKCRFDWNDRAQVQITNNNSIDLSKLNDEDLKKFIDANLKKEE